MTKKTRQVFSIEFKREAVRLLEQGDKEREIGSKLLKIMWNIMRTKLIVFLLIVVSLAGAEEIEHPLPMPYQVQNEARLRDVAKKLGRYTPTYISEELLRGAKILMVLQTVGSGIETKNAYIYICEPSHCTLFYFFRSWYNDLSLKLDLLNETLNLENENGKIVSRISFPFLKGENQVRDLKNKSKK